MATRKARATTRGTGQSPREKGTNPRATNTNPRHIEYMKNLHLSEDRSDYYEER